MINSSSKPVDKAVNNVFYRKILINPGNEQTNLIENVTSKLHVREDRDTSERFDQRLFVYKVGEIRWSI